MPAGSSGGRHHVGVQAGEQGRHGQRDGDGGAGEGPALAAYRAAARRAEQGEGRAGGSTTAASAGAVARVQARNAAGDSDGADAEPDGEARRPGARMSPVVFRARKTAPWARNSAEVVEAAEQRVRVEQVDQAAGVVVVGVQGHAADDVGEGDAPQQRRYQRADEDARCPSGASRRRRRACARYSKATPRTMRRAG